MDVNEMDKAIFEKYKGKHVKLELEPNNFILDGFIDAVFDDCIEFRTPQKTSYISFGKVAYLTLLGE